MAELVEEVLERVFAERPLLRLGGVDLGAEFVLLLRQELPDKLGGRDEAVGQLLGRAPPERWRGVFDWDGRHDGVLVVLQRQHPAYCIPSSNLRKEKPPEGVRGSRNLIVLDQSPIALPVARA